MATLIQAPIMIKAAGEPPKQIEEYVGRVRTGDKKISIARMISPPGWSEPPQKPEFDEYTLVLKGELYVQLKKELLRVKAGQAVIVEKGEKVQYSTPEGAQYIAICLPAFSPDTVNREKE